MKFEELLTEFNELNTTTENIDAAIEVLEQRRIAEDCFENMQQQAEMNGWPIRNPDFWRNRNAEVQEREHAESPE